MSTKTIAVISEKTQMKNPAMSAGPTPEFAAIASTLGPLMNEPTLATLKLTPKANDSSLPLNQAVTMELYATVMHSPPRPKTNLPASIIG